LGTTGQCRGSNSARPGDRHRHPRSSGTGVEELPFSRGSAVLLTSLPVFFPTGNARGTEPKGLQPDPSATTTSDFQPTRRWEKEGPRLSSHQDHHHITHDHNRNISRTIHASSSASPTPSASKTHSSTLGGDPKNKGRNDTGARAGEWRMC